ncbi:MAG: DUF3108 domain-containing protein [Candidatus Omnitrophica bacterium]|nr:DUF3108 domain-containing protein [Candidatus Omnitrophota bacterium]
MNNNRPKVIISRLLNKDVQKNQPKYLVSLLGVIPAGEAVFFNEAIEDYGEAEVRRVYHLSAKAENLKIYSGFIKGAAILDSYLDEYSFDPLLFRQRLSISGKKEALKEVSYDQEAHIMSIAGERRQILPHTQDPLSAMFNIRRMDFEKVKEFEMNINTNQKNYLLKAAARTEEMLIKNKKYKIIILDANISRREKSPYHKTSMQMVLWKDRQNLPIYIKVFSSGFLINCRLIDIE